MLRSIGTKELYGNSVAVLEGLCSFRIQGLGFSCFWG